MILITLKAKCRHWHGDVLAAEKSFWSDLLFLMKKIHHCPRCGAGHHERECGESLEVSPCLPSGAEKYRGTSELWLPQSDGRFVPFGNKTVFVSAHSTEIMLVTVVKRKEFELIRLVVAWVAPWASV